ncbi:MAG: type II secretion system F family protein [Nitrososphaeria archaeon]
MDASILLFYVMIFTGIANLILLILEKDGHAGKWFGKVNILFKNKILGLRFFEKIVYDMASDLIPKYKSISVEKGSEGLLEYIGEIVYKSTLFSMFSLAASLILAYALSNLITIFFGILSFTSILYPYIDYLLLKGEKDRGIYNELVFFAFTEYICQESGRNIDYALNHVINGRLFKWIRTEAKIILTDLLVHSKNLYNSLRERASNTKATVYRRFLDGYAGIYATGGNLLTYMSHQIEVLKNDLKFRIEQFLEKAQMISEINIVLTVIMPIVIIVSSNSRSAGIMQALAFSSLIIYTVAMAFFIEDSRPKTGLGNVKVKPKISEIILTIMVFTVAFIILKNLWLPITIALITFSTIYGYRGKSKLKEARELEEPLPVFVRDIADYRATGKSIYQAIVLSLKEKEYNERFKKEVMVVVNKLSLNSTDLRTDTGIWLFDYVFDCLDLIQKSGGGSTGILIELANMIEDIILEKEKVRRETALASYLTYIAPVLFTLVSASMLALLETIALGTSSGISIFPVNTFQVERDWLYLMIVANTFSNTYITGLLKEGSYENMYLTSITLAIALACILQMDNMVHILKTTVFGAR